MSSWQDWSQQVAASIRAAYRDETGQINPASMAIQHTVLFKFPELKDDAPLQAVVEQFNALEAVWKSTSATGCTQSFLGADAAVLALSSGEETGITTPSSRRRVDGVARAVKF